MNALDQLVPICVLVVDDDDDLRHVMTLFLREHGFSVHPAANDSLAMALAAEHQPDAAVIDIDLGGPTSGFVLAASLRDLIPNIRLFSMSGVVDDVPGREATGVLRHFRKPFSVIDVVAAIRAEPSDARLHERRPRF